MTCKPDPIDDRARARAMTVNYIDAMRREAIRLEKINPAASADVDASANNAEHCADLRLKKRG